MSGQLIAHFDALDGDGRWADVSLATGSSHEADLRVGNIIDQFWVEEDAPGAERALAASLAGTIFGRHPEAREVAVRLEYFEPASMEAYRLGDRPRPSPLYEARFARRAQPPAGAEQ